MGDNRIAFDGFLSDLQEESSQDDAPNQPAIYEAIGHIDQLVAIAESLSGRLLGAPLPLDRAIKAINAELAPISERGYVSVSEIPNLVRFCKYVATRFEKGAGCEALVGASRNIVSVFENYDLQTELLAEIARN